MNSQINSKESLHKSELIKADKHDYFDMGSLPEAFWKQDAVDRTELLELMKKYHRKENNVSKTTGKNIDRIAQVKINRRRPYFATKSCIPLNS